VNDLKNATEPNRIILDVRQPEEFADGHVSGAKLIPLGQLEANLAQISDDAPIYVICRSGNRSKTASDILVKGGKKDVRNVEGGIIAWQAAGYSVSR
jgi:rhodanese-related sulfurtransferase